MDTTIALQVVLVQREMEFHAEPKQSTCEANTMDKYHYRNCQSLLGYAATVHHRSGGVCQLCGAGAGPVVEFDFWRQLSVEHLVGHCQGGYLQQIRELLATRFPDLPLETREDLARRLDEANTVTACSFCNSTTSRDRNSESMAQLLGESLDPQRAVDSAIAKLALVLQRKQADVRWKLESVQLAFDEAIRPDLMAVRSRGKAI
jgi:hypothetical protein